MEQTSLKHLHQKQQIKSPQLVTFQGPVFRVVLNLESSLECNHGCSPGNRVLYLRITVIHRQYLVTSRQRGRVQSLLGTVTQTLIPAWLPQKGEWAPSLMYVPCTLSFELLDLGRHVWSSWFFFWGWRSVFTWAYFVNANHWADLWVGRGSSGLALSAFMIWVTVQHNIIEFGQQSTNCWSAWKALFSTIVWYDRCPAQAA